MAQKDYVVRELEAFMRALARVVALRHARMEVAAALTLDDLSDGLLGLSAADVAALPYELLVSRVDVGAEADLERRMMAFDVLHEKARLLEAEGRPGDAMTAEGLGFRLLLDTRSRVPDVTLGDRAGRLDEIADRIRRAPLDRTTLVLLWRHLLQRRRYAAAEDVLFRLVGEPTEEAGRSCDVVEEGIAAYEALLALPDADLEDGGLSRNEVVEGLEELRRLPPAPLHPPLPSG